MQLEGRAGLNLKASVCLHLILLKCRGNLRLKLQGGWESRDLPFLILIDSGFVSLDI